MSHRLNVYCLHIPNIIGVSLIDHNSKELLHIIIENFFLKKTDISMPLNKQSQMYMASNILQNEGDESSVLMREYIQLSIDNFEIDNQIDVAPFPILLSRKVKHNKHPSPFLNMEVYMKNIVGKNPNRIKYINSVNVFVGTLDLKIDDQTIQMCIEMYKRLNLSKSQLELDKMRMDTIQKFKSVYMKLKDKEISIQNTGRIYIKRLSIEPIKILLTFRAASKSDDSTIAKNFFADFGLIFASIKDADMKFEGLKMTHIFGTYEILGKIVFLSYKNSVSQGI